MSAVGQYPIGYTAVTAPSLSGAAGGTIPASVGEYAVGDTAVTAGIPPGPSGPPPGGPGIIRAVLGTLFIANIGRLMNRGRVMVPVAALLVLSGLPAVATPPACNPKEDLAICYLKVERNNALDELAIAQGALEHTEKQHESLAAYWQQWVDGDMAKAGWWDRLWSHLPFATSRR